MKLENVEKARILISQRDTLKDVIDKAERWKYGHFEFTEHCGNFIPPGRVSITDFPELTKKMVGLVQSEIESIEKELETL